MHIYRRYISALHAEYMTSHQVHSATRCNHGGRFLVGHTFRCTQTVGGKGWETTLHYTQINKTLQWRLKNYEA